jgi:hypothetical protein
MANYNFRKIIQSFVNIAYSPLHGTSSFGPEITDVKS